MPDILISILSSATVSTALVAGLFWISKTWIDERIKNDIKLEYDRKFEAYRSELQTAAEKHATLTLETRAVLHEGITNLASAYHSMCWLTWLSLVSPERLNAERIERYDEEMHVLLPKIISFQARVSTYDPKIRDSFRELIVNTEALDVKIGTAALQHIDGDAQALQKLRQCHNNADQLHGDLMAICADTSMEQLFNRA